MHLEFEGFPKIPRLNKIFGKCVITEKIDGTNAHILIDSDEITYYVGSRTRWINPKDDNYGFAKWVEDNESEILKLGPGHHFGEWYGNGIQRNYGLKEKRWALFNTKRWNEHNPNKPKCCDVVKELYSGEFSFDIVENIINKLKEKGSQQVKGFMKPEGIIIYFHEIRQMAKWTFEYTEGKWNKD